jgi:hypothetical protein
MKKIALFSATDISELQYQINGWLADNKDVDIIETNLTTVSKTVRLSQKDEGELYTFYILYGIINQEAKEIEQLAENESPIAIETEIKEELLKPSN